MLIKAIQEKQESLFLEVLESLESNKLKKLLYARLNLKSQKSPVKTKRS